MLTAFLLSGLAAAGTLAGGLLGRRLELSKQALAFALHFGAGVVLGVVGVELLPRALEAHPVLVITCFLLGGLFYIGIAVATEKFGERLGGEGEGATMWVIVVGVGFDLLTDGVMIAAAQQVGGGLGVLLGIGLLVADAPEAFSTMASLRSAGMDRRRTLLTALVFPLLVLAGVPLGYVLLVGGSQAVEFGILAFTAGLLVLVVVEGLVPEAHAQGRREASKAAALFIAGFALFMFLSLVLN